MEIARRQREVDNVAVAQVGPHRAEPRGIAVGERAQQHGVDHAEDRGGRADAERNRQDGGDGKGRLPAQAAHREREVAYERLHEALPSLARACSMPAPVVLGR
jgi:hypothetical protein